MPKLRILIADDHEVVRHGLRVLLESRPGWEVCGEAADGWEAVSKVSELKPDIVALDIGMPNLNGLDAARQILRRAPHLKSDAARELISAVEALQHNSTFFSTRVAQTCLGSTMRGRHRGRGKDVLTRRERQVVQLLAEGKSTKEVALILSLSVKTAETHRSNIMGKLGLHSISEVVLYAVRNNIVQALSPAAPILNLEEPRSDDDDEEFPVSTAAPSGGSLAE